MINNSGYHKKISLVQFQHSASSAPMGGLYLSYGLEKAGIDFELKIYRQYYYRPDPKRLGSFLEKTGDVLCVGCWSHMLPYVLWALSEVKKKFPDKIIVMGGLGPSEAAKEIMSRFKFVDFIIKGCGIDSLPRLIKAIAEGKGSFRGVHGLFYRRGNDVLSNHYGSFYTESDLPGDLPYHRIKNIRRYQEFMVRTSWGCPYECSYCQVPGISSGRMIFRDIDCVIGEIRKIKEIKEGAGFKVGFVDEGFILDRRRVIKLCSMLRLNRLNVKWICYGRIDRMDEKLMKIMSESGCFSVYYGIEAGSDEMLRKIRKGFDLEQAVKVLLLSKKYFKAVTASFIYLYPFETPKDFIDTLSVKSYLESKRICTQLHPLIPIKGSAIYSAYKHRLFFSPLNELCRHMPEKCAELVKASPEIFYSHYSYQFKFYEKLLDMNRRLRSHGLRKVCL